jgi:hypothetical protein
LFAVEFAKYVQRSKEDNKFTSCDETSAKVDEETKNNSHLPLVIEDQPGSLIRIDQLMGFKITSSFPPSS